MFNDCLNVHLDSAAGIARERFSTMQSGITGKQVSGLRYSIFFLLIFTLNRGSDTDCFVPEINLYIADIDHTFIKPFKCTVFLGQENHELLIDSAVEIAQPRHVCTIAEYSPYCLSGLFSTP